ncbi:hypothetical protein ACFFS4_33645 [Kutzneria kofuensis]|uniref:Uncharacterized protein n=1 Tax=Kutzneria kofuensis TaxID=103725 RepID=A0A7W9KIE5_9PSEU|nr:hypothetical protein [Kutzneria kofuensis]MBB5893175.1 hypothetical protein [Kutzneria kofuensis]
MKQPGDVPNFANVILPSWVWNSNPRGYFSEAAFVGSKASFDENGWTVFAKERVDPSFPPLVNAFDIAESGMVSRYEFLSALAGTETIEMSSATREVGERELEKKRLRAERVGDLVDTLSYWQLSVMLASRETLADVCRDIYGKLLEIPLEASPGEVAFPNASLHVISKNPALGYRLELIAFLLRARYDYDARKGDVSHLHEAIKNGELIFDSSRGLSDGIALFDVYVGPLVGALTPAVWSIVALRPSGVIFYSLGRLVRGFRSDPAELMHMLPVRGSVETVPFPVLGDGAARAAIQWWTERIGKLLSIISDPAVFTDRNGMYVATKHLHAALTVEQLFRRVTSIQVAHRDANARRVLFFSVLDTIDRLTGHDIEYTCSLANARRAYERVEGAIPSASAEILLPAARRAIDALEELQQGFFIARQAGSGDVVFKDDKGKNVRKSLDAATASYVKLLRDATHGHGAKFVNKKTQTNALLAHHNGSIPYDIVLLSYLYLLEFLVDLDKQRKRFFDGGRI